jgi:hypothetical protein
MHQLTSHCWNRGPERRGLRIWLSPCPCNAKDSVSKLSENTSFFIANLLAHNNIYSFRSGKFRCLWMSDASFRAERHFLFIFMLPKSMCNFNRVVEICLGACRYYCQQRSLEILHTERRIESVVVRYCTVWILNICACVATWKQAQAKLMSSCQLASFQLSSYCLMCSNEKTTLCLACKRCLLNC